MNVFQMINSGNPKQIVMRMMNDPKISNNPMAKNMFEMAKNGNLKGLEEMGVYFDKDFSDFKNQFTK